MNLWSGLLLAVVVPALAFACGGKTSNDGNDGGQQGSSGSGGGGSGGGFGSGSGGGSGGSSGAGSGGGSGAGSGASSGGAPVDASPTDDGPIVVVDAQSPPCVSNGMSGSGGQGTCELAVSELCNDGTTYSVTCQCPEAMCYCTQSAPNGSGSGAGFSYSGCPSCSVTEGLYKLCGFPQ